MLRLVLAFLFLTPTAFAQAAYDVTLPVDSHVPAARDAFARGVELLHSFEYDDARDAFRAAQAADPEFLMPFWGEAMTHNHPVWQRQDADAGLAVLSRLDTRMAETGVGAVDAGVSARWNYLEAVRILFGDGDPDTKEARDDAYLEHLGQFARYSASDRDARAFYALALLGSAHEGRDYAIYGQAAAAAQSVLDEDPEHPGALHYLIHAYDDPDHAELALPAARAYAEIVSAASHALHMPTHIYFALGLWDEASALNVRAFEAAREASARRGEPLNNHGWHALYWLAYSDVQRGELADALARLDRARDLYAADSSDLALRHLVRMRAHVAAGLDLTRESDRPADAEARVWFSLPRDRMTGTTLAIDRWTSSLHLVPREAAEADIRDLAGMASDDADPALRVLAAMAPPVGQDLDEDADEAIAAYAQRLAEAVAWVDALPVAFGPPASVMYPHELLLVPAIQSGELEVARCLIDRVEARAPGRRFIALSQTWIAEAEGAPTASVRMRVPDIPGCPRR